MGRSTWGGRAAIGEGKVCGRWRMYCENNRPMPLRFPIALVLSIICLAVPAWADYQVGMDAYSRGDYATALRE